MEFARNIEDEGKLRAHLINAKAWPEEIPTPQVYTTDRGHYALLSHHPFGGTLNGERRWHISLQGPERLPSWNELTEAAHKLRPGVGFVIGVPPESLWMNVHPHVLHLWESKDDGLQAEWRANARGDRPT